MIRVGDILKPDGEAMQFLRSLYPQYAKAKTLYHYTRLPLAYVFSRGKSDLYCTSCKELNDTQEFILGGKKILATIESHGVLSVPSIVALEGILKDLYETNDNTNPWIMSFSLERDSLAQWNGYTDHRDGGYAFGFDREKLERIGLAKTKNRAVFLLPCVYREGDTNKILDLLAEKLLKPFFARYKKLPEQKVELVEIASVLFVLASMLKSDSFACENEVRLVAFNTKSLPVGLIGGKHRISIGIGDAGFGRVSELISEVVVSPHGNTEFLRHIAKSCGFYSSIIRQSKIPYRGW